MIAISTSERNGNVVSAAFVKEDDDIMILSKSGKVVRTRANEVSVYSRTAQGVRLINLGDDTVASIRRAERTDENEEIEHLNIEVPEDADTPTAVDEIEDEDTSLDDDLELDGSDESSDDDSTGK